MKCKRIAAAALALCMALLLLPVTALAAPGPAVIDITGTTEIAGTATMGVSNTVNITSAGTLNVQSGGTLHVFSGGRVVVKAGGTLNALAGCTVIIDAGGELILEFGAHYSNPGGNTFTVNGTFTDTRLLTGTAVELSDGSIWNVIADNGTGDPNITLVKDGFIDGSTYLRSDADAAIAAYQTTARTTYSDAALTARLISLADNDILSTSAIPFSYSHMYYYWYSDRLTPDTSYAGDGFWGVTYYAADQTTTQMNYIRPVITVNKSAVADYQLFVTDQPDDVDWLTLNNQDAVFSVAAQGNNITYQWQVYDGTSWADISGATSRTLTIAPGSANYASGKTFYCVLNSSWGGTVCSNEVSIKVLNWQEYAQQNAQSGTDYTVSGDTITVHTAAGLGWIALRSNENIETFDGKTIVLDRDIDLSGRNWMPIGLADLRFMGTFDGAMHTISGLFINLSTTDDSIFIGLFSYARNAIIKNFYLEGTSITCTYTGGGDLYDLYIGPVCGYARNTGFYNIGVGEMDVSYSGEVHNLKLGGVVGLLREQDVKQCIFNCYSMANIVGSGNSAAIGGIVGQQAGDKIRNCYFGGSITCNTTYKGAISGINELGEITGCYWRSGCGAQNGYCYPDMTAMDYLPSDAGTTMLTEALMKAKSGDGNLLDALNAWVSTANEGQDPAPYQTWTIDDTKNGGYPVFGTPKAPVSLTAQIQTYAVGTSGASFLVSHLSLSGFSVRYYVGGAWTLTPPIGAGQYPVRITRPQDSTHYSYDSGVLGAYFVLTPNPPTGDLNIWLIAAALVVSCGGLVTALVLKKRQTKSGEDNADSEKTEQ